MDIKELFHKRKNAFTSAKKVYQECFNSLMETKKEMIDKAVKNATEQAIAEFNDKHGKDVKNVLQTIEENDAELALLKCPDNNYHERPSMGYYRCLVCNFVWDDEPDHH